MTETFCNLINHFLRLQSGNYSGSSNVNVSHRRHITYHSVNLRKCDHLEFGCFECWNDHWLWDICFIPDGRALNLKRHGVNKAWIFLRRLSVQLYNASLVTETFWLLLNANIMLIRPFLRPNEVSRKKGMKNSANLHYASVHSVDVWLLVATWSTCHSCNRIFWLLWDISNLIMTWKTRCISSYRWREVHSELNANGKVNNVTKMENYDHTC